MNDQVAEIDEEIAPLIEEMWKAGLYTTNACQEVMPGLAWVEFFDSSDALQFMDIVAGPFSNDIGGLYNRVRRFWTDPSGKEPPFWQYHCRPYDRSVLLFFEEDGSVEERSVGPAEFMMPVSIKFPKDDLPVLLKRMRRFNSDAKTSDENPSTELPCSESGAGNN